MGVLMNFITPKQMITLVRPPSSFFCCADKHDLYPCGEKYAKEGRKEPT